MKLIARHAGMRLEVWARWDREAEIYELYTDNEGIGYIGSADTLEDAKRVALEWFGERSLY